MNTPSHVIDPNTVYGRVHDATHCCIEGFSCWVGSVVEGPNSTKMKRGHDGYQTFEGKDRAEAISLLEAYAKSTGRKFVLVQG